MKLVDALAVVLLFAAAGSFFCGEVALARADDLRALYWLVVGMVSLRACVQISRPEAKA
jgi:hypothetical protein